MLHEDGGLSLHAFGDRALEGATRLNGNGVRREGVGNVAAVLRRVVVLVQGSLASLRRVRGGGWGSGACAFSGGEGQGGEGEGGEQMVRSHGGGVLYV